MRLREAFNKKTDETWKKVQTGGGGDSNSTFPNLLTGFKNT